MPKTAKRRRARVFEMECPYCEQPMDSPYNGSQLWNSNDSRAGKIIECSACGAEVKMPKSVESD